MNNCVAITGAGLIGASWSALFSAVGGYHVKAWDPDKGGREAFERAVAKATSQLALLGPHQGGTVTVVDTLQQAVDGAHMIQENAPESVEIKHALYRDIEQFAPSDALIATSTSSLTWSALAPGLRDASRFVVAHPFNPPHLVPLVEVFAPNEATAERAVTFYKSVGRTPVRLRKEAVGHIANRLASALWREAVNIVAEGIADVEEVDTALVNGPGLRWSIIGAHMAYHLGGGAGGIEDYLRKLGPSQERRWQSLGNPSLTPEVCKLLVEGIAREAAGRSIEQLEAERDAALIDTLKSRRKRTS